MEKTQQPREKEAFVDAKFGNVTPPVHEMSAFTNVLTRLSPFRITFVGALGQHDASLVSAPLYETMSGRKKRTMKIVNLTIQKYRGLPRFTAGEKIKG